MKDGLDGSDTLYFMTTYEFINEVPFNSIILMVTRAVDQPV